MAIDEQKFREFLNGNRSAYPSRLKSIEEKYTTPDPGGINGEYVRDRCASLLDRISDDYKNATEKDKMTYRDYGSFLRAYVAFKQIDAFKAWLIAEKEYNEKDADDIINSLKHAFVNPLTEGKVAPEQKTPQCFTIVDLKEFAELCFFADCLDAKVLDGQQGTVVDKTARDEYLAFLDYQNGNGKAQKRKKKNQKQERIEPRAFVKDGIDNAMKLYRADLMRQGGSEDNDDGKYDEDTVHNNLKSLFDLGRIRSLYEVKNKAQKKEVYTPMFSAVRELVKENPRAAAYDENMLSKLTANLIDFMKQNKNLPDDKSQGETDVGLNTILYGPPGTGKTYHSVIYAVAVADKAELSKIENEAYSEVLKRYNAYKAEGQIAFTTFHQSFGYEEFIEGIKPIVEEQDGEEDAKIGGDIKYDVQSGVFKEFCERAANDPKNNYVFIIDEINRGNISKIFGELITLIESSKREGKAEGMSVILPYSKKPFSVPQNVYIIGTMNTADRSIAAIDTALRRRFRFKEMLPNPGVLVGVEVMGLKIDKLLTDMNKRISVLYDREHTIGHAYFLPLAKKNNNTIEELANIFSNNIVPLLQEYFYEDYEKIRLVLGDKQKEVRKTALPQFIAAVKNEYKDLFGIDDADKDEDLLSYTINEAAFGDIEAYAMTYQGAEKDIGITKPSEGAKTDANAEANTTTEAAATTEPAEVPAEE